MGYNKKTIEHGVIRVDPMPTPEELKQYYSQKYFQNNKGTYSQQYSSLELEYRIFETKITLEAIKQGLKNKGKDVSLLELGFGEGFFLNQAHSEGWQVKGIDFSEFAIQKWHPHLKEFCSFGDLYECLDSHIQNKCLYDICVLENVFVHLIDPVLLLNQLKKILKPNGIILFSVPNNFSPLQLKARELNLISKDFWFVSDHLYYFNTKNVLPFVADLGFKVLDMYTSFPIDFFLFHSGSNYVEDSTKGKEAHFARMQIDLEISKQGYDVSLNLYRAMAKSGIGRNVTLLVTP
jgi:2-polyprenyl-3-methyl-5-hydroxy-6-metoxy-1,4-benzoquinol methylase